MKIQCDVCDKDEASLFCVADEAALCAACDHRVHHANKLAGKHHRFSLHRPCPQLSLICDICQEKRAFLFCQQDRAILCRDCDVSIHKANQICQNHARFLLTGLRLSAVSSVYSDSTESDSSTVMSSLTDTVPQVWKDEPVFAASATNGLSAPSVTTVESTLESCGESMGSEWNLIHSSVSSISEYLIETLPGWHVEELLDSTNLPSSYGFSKNGDSNDHVMLPLWDAGLHDECFSQCENGVFGSLKLHFL